MMKSTMLLTIALLLPTAAFAKFGDGPKGPPPEIAAQLDSEQLERLRNATTMEEKGKLLDSWGIQPPARRPGDHRPPPLDEATKAQLDALKARYDAAATDEEKDMIRGEMKELFRSTRSKEQQGEIRGFFRQHPHRDSSRAGSAADENGSSR